MMTSGNCYLSTHVRESGFRDPENLCPWNPEFGKFLLVESGTQLKGSQTPLTIGIQSN